MTTRTVIINFPYADELEQLIDITGRDELYRAIGYLTVWNRADYNDVVIHFRDITRDQPELLAVYGGAEGRRYVIGAVFSPSSKAFGFHS